jgi:hypothetical protein
MVYETAVFAPPDRVVLLGYGEKLSAVDEIRFSRHDNLTLIEYTAVLWFHNFFKYLGPLLRPTLKKVGTDAMDGLARALGG